MRVNQVGLRCVVACAGLFVGFHSAVVSADAINLGQAANYAVIGMGGVSISNRSDFEIYQSATVINGNVAVGPYSTWSHGMDATINGRVDNDLTNAAPSVTGTVTGGVFQIDTTSIINDALNASNAAAAFAPTQTFSTLSEGQIVVGNGGLNVIRVTDAVTLKTSLTLQGTASDQFIFQLTTSDKDALTLSGMTMNMTGVDSRNVLWNLNGTGGEVKITSMSDAQLVNGFFLAPFRNITVDQGNVLGSIIGGGGGDDAFLSIHSSSNVTLPPSAVPLPASVWAGLALLGMLGAHKTLLRGPARRAA